MRSTLKISFLATGNEIIEGDFQDTNGLYFAHELHEQGAQIYQHIKVSDQREEIIQSLRYLLTYSDALIITGGMGPTSDDNTRHAVSELTERPLIFDQPSWDAIETRFQKFRLKLVPSNRQQALFPEGGQVLPNQNGSAPGCYLQWEGKHIFMLPGPPRECRPIFHEQVLPILQTLPLFRKKETLRWLTLGLSESEISEKIDALAKPLGFDTGFRWSYPYLEIKIIAKDDKVDLDLINQVNALLDPFCVSTDRKDAVETLHQQLSTFGKFVYLSNEMVEGFSPDPLKHEYLIYTDKKNREDNAIYFAVEAHPKITNEHPGQDTITFCSEGFVNANLAYEHEINLPYRGPEVIHAAQAYLAWQLARFIKSLGK